MQRHPPLHAPDAGLPLRCSAAIPIGVGSRLRHDCTATLPSSEISYQRPLPVTGQEPTGAICWSLSTTNQRLEPIAGSAKAKRSQGPAVGVGMRWRWWAYVGSNHGPLPCQGSALPLSYTPISRSLSNRECVPAENDHSFCNAFSDLDNHDPTSCSPAEFRTCETAIAEVPPCA
jgi:hypothetical protein